MNFLNRSFENVDNSVPNLYVNIDEKYCNCDDSLSDEMLAKIQEVGCTSIRLGRGTWSDLSFLKALNPKIKSLSVSVWEFDIDWTSIFELSELEVLKVDGHIKQKVDFLQLPNLKRVLYWWDNKNADSLCRHTGIEQMELYGAKTLNLNCLEKMTALKQLELVRGQIKNLEGVERIKQLATLRLIEMTKLEDISQLNQAGWLLCLDVRCCNKLSFPESLEGLKSLMELNLLRQKHLDSLAFLLTLPSLEVLRVFEISIKGGEVGDVAKIPTLKLLNMDSRRHYNIDIKALSNKLHEQFGDYKIPYLETFGLDPYF
ncbi:hypothetical protein ISG33_11080 [Glaciecola sp. MH2013]|uniref:hypothetical protein n=1 Tax=Glaciecola sp. MH2013 TaxID=2785524 RepID=UPI00189F28E5|nr:hypothetical protein [Glaciecola sp. MH2013]MBF7073943.1 hypothetical protein [Glaciecola sp. MH2013]